MVSPRSRVAYSIPALLSRGKRFLVLFRAAQGTYLTGLPKYVGKSGLKSNALRSSRFSMPHKLKQKCFSETTKNTTITNTNKPNQRQLRNIGAIEGKTNKDPSEAMKSQKFLAGELRSTGP